MAHKHQPHVSRGQVYRRDTQTDWAGKTYVRLDVRDEQSQHDLHLYVPAASPLARLALGRTLRIVVEPPLA